MAVANGFSFLIPARLEHARILPLQLWITCPILRIGPMIPASDFGPVGEGVTFLPRGNARGHVPGPGCTTPPTRNVGGLSPKTEPCEPISRRWAGPRRGTSQPHGDVSHSGPSDPKNPLVLCPGL